MIFSVFANLNNNETKAIAGEVLDVLKDTDCRIYFDEKYYDVISNENCEF